MKSSMKSKENQLSDEGNLGLTVRTLTEWNSLPWKVVSSLSWEIFKLRLTDLLIGNEMVEGESRTYTLDGRTSFMVYDNPHPFLSKSLKLSLPLLPGTGHH